MTDSQTFSLERFTRYARLAISLNGRKMLTLLAAVFGAMTAIGLFTAYSLVKFNHLDATTLNFALSTRTTIYMYCWFSVIIAFAGAFVIDNMDNKARRCSHLMVPASMAEKFTFGALGALVLAPIAAMVVLVAYTVVLYLVVNYWFLASSPISMNMVSALSIFDVPLENHISVLFQQSVFVLGCAIWYKLSIVKTIVTELCIGFVFIIVMTILASNGVIRDVNVSPETLTTIINTLMAVATVAFWALSYYLYTRSQIVGKILNRK